MKYGLLTLQGVFVLIIIYVGFVAVYSLLKRKALWERKGYNDKQKKRYLKGWFFVGIACLVLIPMEIIDFVEMWNRLMK